MEELSLGGSAGNLPKWYCVDETGKYLYVKGRSSLTAFEPEIEVFCSELATYMHLPNIKQFLVNIPELSDLPLSASYDFSDGRNCMTLFRYLRSNVKNFSLTTGEKRYNAVVSVLSKEDKILHDSILAFDYIVGNPDRHLRNFECHVDAVGVHLIPAFDFGMALFSDKAILDITKLGANPYSNRHSKQLELLKAVGYQPRLKNVDYKIINTLVLKYLNNYPHVNIISEFIQQNILVY